MGSMYGGEGAEADAMAGSKMGQGKRDEAFHAGFLNDPSLSLHFLEATTRTSDGIRTSTLRWRTSATPNPY